MGRRYAQLQTCERLVIDRLNSDGRSLREIGRTLGRSPSTISRELKRNGRSTKAWFSGYEPRRAQWLAERRQRRPLGHKLARQPALWAVVRDHLAMGR
ncbi:MAG: helix-turn-helix domain-containing protein [Alphaproteobacteria bacterium]|nr:helix-turn-helix domain-containing protein [Alphaproteobacteria bacterium]